MFPYTCLDSYVVHLKHLIPTRVPDSALAQALEVENHFPEDSGWQLIPALGEGVLV